MLSSTGPAKPWRLFFWGLRQELQASPPRWYRIVKLWKQCFHG